MTSNKRTDSIFKIAFQTATAAAAAFIGENSAAGLFAAGHIYDRLTVK